MPLSDKEKKEQRIIETLVKGSGYYQQFKKETKARSKKLEHKFLIEKLEAKIKEKGSLYGKVPMKVSTKLAELRQGSQINKVDNLFKDDIISTLY